MTGWYSVLINPGSAFACKGVGNLCVKPRCWKLELTQTAFKSTHIPAFFEGFVFRTSLQDPVDVLAIISMIRCFPQALMPSPLRFK